MPRHRKGSPLATLLALGLTSLLSADPVEDYRLFVGLNVEVRFEEDFAAITSYSNKKIRFADQSGDIKDVRNIRFTYDTKLGRDAIEISDVESEQISAKTHARVRAMQNQQALQDYSSKVMDAQMAAMRREGLDEQDFPTSVTPGGGAADDADAPPPDFASQLSNLTEMTDNLTDPDALADHIRYGASPGRDSIRVSGVVRSPVPVRNAYIIGVVRFTTEITGAGQMLLFKRLGKIGPDPRKFSTIGEGFPLNAVVDEINIHVYQNGREFVTNQSAKQILLSREDAQEYAIHERMGEHKHETVPPAPVWNLAPSPLFSASDSEVFDHPITVNVDERGRVTSIDPKTKVPPYVAAIATQLPFFPALENGQPVAGVAQINLHDFFR